MTNDDQQKMPDLEAGIATGSEGQECPFLSTISPIASLKLPRC